MNGCLDFIGALTALLNNDINPLVRWETIVVFPPLGIAAVLLAAMFALMRCFT